MTLFDRPRLVRSVGAQIATVLALSACTAAPGPGPSGPTGASPGGSGGATSPGATGAVTMFSTQLNPVEEQEKMRTTILAGYGGEAEFIGAPDSGAFIDRVRTEAETGPGDVSLLGALHGEFATLGSEELLTDLSDVVGDLGITDEYVELGKLGTDQQQYIPWMQATYIMAARQEAMEHLPDGAEIDALTWEQITEWGANIQEATGQAKLGFPAGEDGLRHRFLQGYAYPAFTGGVNTTFANEDAVAMWTWLQDTWQYVNPASSTYGFMDAPLQSGEVWVAWDHTARLITALRDQPDDIVAFPVPAGPEGRAFMPVVAGLAVPASAPNADGARELIRYLLQPETQGTTLAQVSFFPVLTDEVTVELDAGVTAEQEAVAAQTNAEDALPALLPIGLGDQGGAYNQVFIDALQQIVIEDQDPATALPPLADTLQGVLDQVEAPCWAPDPPSEGACQVAQE